MDEKDRHIVTFGSDEPVSEEIGYTEGSDFTQSSDFPEGDAAETIGVAGDTFVMMPSDVEAIRAGAADDTDTLIEEAEAEAQTVEPEVIAAEAEPALETSTEIAAIPRPEYSAEHMASDEPSHVKAMPKKEKKYVTTGALIACMIVTMLVSSLLGALFAGAFSSRNDTDNRASRNDSELSELNLGDSTGSKLSVGEIIDRNADAVVEIVVEGTTQGMWGQLQLTQGAGSGVIVKENGYIATNYHVVDGANKVEVTLHNGDVYNATIVGTDPSNDIAVVKIDANDLTTAVIGDSSKVSVGDLAVAIGNPLGQLGGTATSGIISALDRTLTIEGTTLTLLQTDAAINGGNSGGGLFSGNGELIGIVESKASAVGVEGLAFALPINSVSGIINDMIENGGSAQNASSSTPAVGIVISEVSEENAQYYGLDSAGVYIAQVTGSNAQKAGFKEQDRIVSLDGKAISNSSEFIALVRKHKVGDTVAIVVSRGGQEIEIKTELEALSNTQE